MSAVSNTRILFWSPFSDSKKLLPVVLSLHSPCKSMVCLVAGCGGSSVLGFLYRDDLQETKVFFFLQIVVCHCPIPGFCISLSYSVGVGSRPVRSLSFMCAMHLFLEVQVGGCGTVR